MTFLPDKFKNKFTAFLARLIINLVARTSKTAKINEDAIAGARDKSKNVIYAFWHGRQFMLVWTHRFQGVYLMTSYSRDGELQTGIMSGFGYNIIRGSHRKRGAVEGTLELIKRIENGDDAAFAVDGPRGPAFQVKPGIIFIAQKTGRPIVPVTFSARFKIVMNNWDRYCVPFPFNDCAVVYGRSLEVRRTDDIHAKCRELESELNRITG
ncbi:MAG: lysophospholipid acyltransferase family protein, partial [Elusimicrobia bacterium]|nr:lysophospholipid acyltransferase family protein [Elusimicrobiota bacterium]